MEGTRDRVVATAGRLFREQGYHATGLNQVLAESNAPKGSLYFHFPGGKEQLAADALARSGAELGERMAAALAATDDPATGLATLAELFAAELRASDFRRGCPVATVALEAAAGSDPIRTTCDGVYSAWLAGLTERLRSWGVSAERAEPLATLTLSTLQGALLLARTRRDADLVSDVAAQLGALLTAEVTR